MPRRNRVDPWGDLFAVPERGMFTGNRGCVVDDGGHLVRHHDGRRWITCRTTFGDQRHPLAAPGRWTPLFFLDDAVALAAGHRPCATCRREDYRAYRDAVTAASGATEPLGAADLDGRLERERLRRGRGVDRAHDRIVWLADPADLPDGTVVVGVDRRPELLVGDGTYRFRFDGWRHVDSLRPRGPVRVLTPPTSVGALRNGFTPTLRPSTIGAA